MKRISYILFVVASLILSSCISSQSTTTVSQGMNIRNYRYVVYGAEDSGDAELSDILLIVQNELSKKLQVVSSSEALTLTSRGENVISPRINIKTEKWDGGRTYITISFYDCKTDQLVAVIKSNGIGWSISQDQELALFAIKKELNKVFQ